MSEFMPSPDLVNSGLSELENQILEFERTWWRHAGAKESSIKELFKISAPPPAVAPNSALASNTPLIPIPPKGNLAHLE
jgi:hypothetical protein